MTIEKRTPENHWLAENHANLLSNEQHVFDALQGESGKSNYGFFDKIATSLCIIDKGKAAAAELSPDLKEDVVKYRTDVIMEAAKNEALQVLSQLDTQLDAIENQAENDILQAILPDPPKSSADDLKISLNNLIIQMFMMNKTKPEISEILRDEAKQGNKKFYNAVINAPVPLLDKKSLDMAKSALIDAVAHDQLQAKAATNHIIEKGRSKLFLTRKKIQKMLKS